MAAVKSVKKSQRHFRIVGVIASRADLALAMRISHPPDLFELRLDRLSAMADELEKMMLRLRAPIIITARHPAEGGANNLQGELRQQLLGRFLPRARYIDVELRAAKHLGEVLDLATRKNVRRIISFHDFGSTPDLGRLRAKARAARSLRPDIFKVATRVDTPAQLARLLDFTAKGSLGVALSTMGIGKLGAISRILLTQCGSVLAYASMNEPQVQGQMSLEQLRTALGVFGID
jgi:3-dehydroquinate dehydratase I